MTAMPPSTVIAVARPRLTPQWLSRLVTGRSSAVISTATSSGIVTSEM